MKRTSLPLLGRRSFITLLGGATAWPLAARAQHDGPVARVGVIAPFLDGPPTRDAYQVFLSDLRKLGFVEGRNLLRPIPRMDQGVPQAFAGASELVLWKADILVAWGPELALQAAGGASIRSDRRSSRQFDPIASGYVQSLARPGGNVTGVVSRQPELAAKQIELLAEAIPGRNRFGVLWDMQSADQFKAAEREAHTRGLVLRSFKLENPPYDFAVAFRAFARMTCRCFLCCRALSSRSRPPESEASPSSIGCQPSTSSSITSRPAD